MDFGPRNYVVKRIDGDYAYLIMENEDAAEEKCVARALLPEGIYEGAGLLYENLQYSLR